MNFPRFHVFVDAECPALTSGKITSWVSPSKLVAMISPRSSQNAPPGSESARIIRSWRTRHEAIRPEVQIVIEGELMTGFLLGLKEYITDVYQFDDSQAVIQADFFAQLDEDLDDLSCAVNQASDALDKFIWHLEKIDPETVGLDTSVPQEAEAQLFGGHSAVSEAIDRIAERFVFKPLLGSAEDKKAA